MIEILDVQGLTGLVALVSTCFSWTEIEIDAPERGGLCGPPLKREFWKLLEFSGIRYFQLKFGSSQLVVQIIETNSPIAAGARNCTVIALGNSPTKNW